MTLKRSYSVIIILEPLVLKKVQSVNFSSPNPSPPWLRLLVFIAVLQSSDCPADWGWVPQEENFENGDLYARELLRSALGG